MLNPNLTSEVSTVQGNAGVGLAIAYFTGLGHTVSVPLTDTQGYDLVFDNGKLNKVQVKTTRFKYKDIAYRCGLRTTYPGRRIMFDNKKIDYLFIATPEALYFIPSELVKVKCDITLGKKYEKFKVKL